MIECTCVGSVLEMLLTSRIRLVIFFTNCYSLTRVTFRKGSWDCNSTFPETATSLADLALIQSNVPIWMLHEHDISFRSSISPRMCVRVCCILLHMYFFRTIHDLTFPTCRVAVKYDMIREYMIREYDVLSKRNWRSFFTLRKWETASSILPVICTATLQPALWVLSFHP